MYQTILYDLADHIATITLNRPEKLNAFTPQMLAEMIDALDHADADDGVRAVIVTGAGRAFCAGADLSAGTATFDYGKRGGDSSPLREDGSIDYAHAAVRDNAGKLTLRMFNCLKPVIGAINGPSVGVGVTMQLAMDVRVASETARFGFVFARRGLVPEGAAAWFLPRIVGIAKALEWTLSGRIFDAAEALSAGLVHSVHPQAGLLAAARQIATDMTAQSAPVSVALTRQMMWRGLGMTHPMEAHRIDSRAIYARGSTKDVAEGVQSFLGKRAPSFPNTVSADMPDFFPWWDEPDYA
jgi:enoyl-CoA hydratase/carnithine racemase